MKRRIPRYLGILAALILGWMAAGAIPSWTGPVNVSYASDDADKAMKHTQEDRENAEADAKAAEAKSGETKPGETKPAEPIHAESHPHAAAGEKHADKHEAHGDSHDDAGVTTANLLRPAMCDIHWYRPVLGVIAGLFVAAIVLGWPAQAIRGPLPPDPADSHHDDHHDDHNHDAHGGHDSHGHDTAHAKH